MKKVYDLLVLGMTLAQIVICVYLSIHFKEIPLHWNLYGDIDRWGSPMITAVFPATSFVLWLILSYVRKRPQYFNIPANCANPKRAYRKCLLAIDCSAIAITTICLAGTLWIFAHS